VDPIYRAFLGRWQLIPESCRYEQGEPPTSGLYRIEAGSGGTLHFRAEWVDAEGRAGSVALSGVPDGQPVPFPGGALADALSIEAVSARELNSYAYLEGRALMIAQRQLDETGQAMRITQVVRLPNGERPANVAVYRRVPEG
jgi:hypothetical protein